MTKPTGRPRGRPKTKEYRSMTIRMPQDLADQVQRYASRKRQSLSDVVRDGLVVLLQDADPHPVYVLDTKTDIAPSLMSYINAESEAAEVEAEVEAAESEAAEETTAEEPVITLDIKEGEDAACVSYTKEEPLVGAVASEVSTPRMTQCRKGLAGDPLHLPFPVIKIIERNDGPKSIRGACKKCAADRSARRPERQQRSRDRKKATKAVRAAGG